MMLCSAKAVIIVIFCVQRFDAFSVLTLLVE